MCNNDRVAGDKHEMTMDELRRRFAECEERIARIVAKGDERRAEMRAQTREMWRRVERLRAENAEMRRRA
jgi:hypothetical protein